MVRFFPALLSFFCAATSAVQAETLAGPYVAEPVRALDGDSFEARVRIWLDQDVTVIVRLRGIDAAELDAPCPSARAMAALAQWALAGRLRAGPLTLSAISRDKYGGRVVATVKDAAGADLAAALQAAGLVRPYEGRRPDWCTGF